MSRVLLPWVCLLGAVVLCLTTLVNATPLRRQDEQQRAPVVRTRHQGAFRGIYNDTSNVEAFYGIPFAQPPVGELRFQKTRSLKSYTKSDIRDATKLNKKCLQGKAAEADPEASEDCLYLQIHRPEGTSEGDDLPVMLWIYGGAWTSGSTQSYGYPSALVQRSVQLDKKVIHVAGEYRLGPFGFLGGSGIEQAARNGTGIPNAGYYDQREVMRWVQKNIRAFGGDPKKVTIFGQSAGAQSVGAHLLANGGNNEGLFRAAIMQSGGPSTATRYRFTDARPQAFYEKLLNQTQCNTLECLRQLPAEQLRQVGAVINMQTYVFGYPAWVPLLDEYFIPDTPSTLYAKGAIADVPFIVGTNLDEGTLFAGWADNVTDDATLVEGLAVGQGNNSKPLLPALLKLWPDRDDVGSPFRPELYGIAADDRYFGAKSQYKRAAGIAGDWAFQAPVRSLLHGTRRLNRRSWGYHFEQPTSEFYGEKASHGVRHGSEIAYVYNYPAAPAQDPTSAQAKFCSASQINETASFMSAAWINFAHHLDPNGSNLRGQHWPYYSDDGDDGDHDGHSHSHDTGRLMRIQGGNLTTIRGDFRKEQVGFFLKHEDVYRL